jgi:hypothetical protein
MVASKGGHLMRLAMDSQVTVSGGKLAFLTVQYVRTARYRMRHQPESHRTPRYRVEYRLENQPAHEAMVEPNPRLGLVATIRASKLGDRVQVTMSQDGSRIIDWINETEEALQEAVWRDFPAGWGDSD